MKHDDQNPIEPDRYEQLCDFVFGELDDEARAAIELELAKDPALAAERTRLEATIGLVHDALPTDELPPAMRATLTEAARAKAAEAAGTLTPMPRRAGGTRLSRWFGTPLRAAAAGLLLLVGGFALTTVWNDPLTPTDQTAATPSDRREKKTRSLASQGFRDQRQLEEESVAQLESLAYGDSGATRTDADLSGLGYVGEGGTHLSMSPAEPAPKTEVAASSPNIVGVGQGSGKSRGGGTMKRASGPLRSAPLRGSQTGSDGFFLGRGQKEADAAAADSPLDSSLNDLAAAVAPPERARFRGPGDTVPPGGGSTPSDFRVARGPAGPTSPAGQNTPAPLRKNNELARSKGRFAAGLDVVEESADLGDRLAAMGYSGGDDEDAFEDDERRAGLRQAEPTGGKRQPVLAAEQIDAMADGLFLRCRVGESETPSAMFFRCWGAHPFQRTADDSLSTFAVDVDTASYTLARRTLQAGRLPVREQVRTEEFVNYFRADQPAPTDGVFAIGVESAPSLFHTDPNVEMLRVTVRGKDVAAFERQPLALTFVIDVSGSMSDNLDLVKSSLELLLTQLAPSDSIALVKFSTTAGVVSPMLSAANRGQVEDALAALHTEGGTNVEAGIQAGYKLAADALTPGAVNRVILLSDGVGNIGETKAEQLLALVAAHKSQGIYLNTIGVGMGSHNDDFLEQLANRGDGVCLYIDSEAAAQKALVDEFTKTLQPIARDVKIQVEFDPAQVESYRQLGYENRALADADFRKDAVDAGEVNAGHQVTALYEIVRVGGRTDAPLATVRVRHKPPFAVDAGQLGVRAKADAEVALEIERAMQPGDFVPSFESGSAGYRRAVLVAQFAELLRESVHTRNDSLDRFEREVMRFADRASDEETIEFSELVAIALPLLREREAARSDELQDLIEELCQLEYAAGVREQMARREEAPEPDPDVELAFQKEIEGVQAKIRELLIERFGASSEEPAVVAPVKGTDRR